MDVPFGDNFIHYIEMIQKLQRELSRLQSENQALVTKMNKLERDNAALIRHAGKVDSLLSDMKETFRVIIDNQREHFDRLNIIDNFIETIIEERSKEK